MVIWDEGRWMPFLTTPIVFYMKLEIRNQFIIIMYNLQRQIALESTSLLL